MMGRGGAAVEAVSVAKWEGPALVIMTKTDMGNGPQESTQKWTLAGSVLTIETTERARHAEDGLQEVEDSRR